MPAGERWLFDPHAPGPLFAQLDPAAPLPTALRLSCAPDVLTRLVTERSFFLREEDTASFDGDVDDLLPIAEALEEGSGALRIRPSRK
ncbi:MAG: hypothetical protein IT384_30720 [Deltaproteobacteria bacterium]|nr:hypothetical protein [Deltaproteobacteria bacterium]